MPLPSSTTTPRALPPWAAAAAAALVLLFFFANAVHTAHRDSVSWDESQHLYSGWLSWTHGDFGYNPEVPPLIKMWDAIPLLHRDVRQPAYTGDPFKKEGFVLGQRFLATNGIDRTLIPARIMASVLSVFLAALLFLCAWEMFGQNAALFALLLFCLDPNILAHSAFVTTDIGASLTTLAAVYAFFRYTKRPTLPRLLLLGLAVGLAMTAKFTGVFIIPILCLIAALDYWRARQSASGPAVSPSLGRTLAALVFASLFGVAFVWTLYHFRYAARPGSLQLNPLTAEYLQKLSSPLTRSLLTSATHLHLLPEAYLYGLADTKISAGDLPSYFFGKDYSGASHWYFPAAFLIKSTLPLLILLGIAIVVVLQGRWPQRREILFLTVPPLFLFLLSSSSDLGIGYRHLLPMFPLLYILIAGCAAFHVSRHARLVYGFAALLIWQLGTTLAARPGLLAYANEAWGGPSHTHLYLSDSNTDWGQQLKAVRQFLATHPSQPCYFAYFAQGPVDFRDYGIHCQVLPTGSAAWTGLDTMRFGDNANVSGTVLISDGVLAGADIPGKGNLYKQFIGVPPAAVIDRGVYVYQGHFTLGSAAAVEHIAAAEAAAQAHDAALETREARTAVTLDPGSPEAHMLLGDALAASSDPQAAQAEYAVALHSSGLDPVFQKSLVTELQNKASH